jgi:hypothetical protein
MRSIKETMRSLLASLQYNVPIAWYRYAAVFCVTRFNLFPHSSTPWGASPRELMTDYRRDVRSFFGEYCQCEVPYPDNSMKVRTLSCISLYPTGSRSGSVKFMVLKTMKVETSGPQLLFDLLLHCSKIIHHIDIPK